MSLPRHLYSSSSSSDEDQDEVRARTKVRRYRPRINYDMTGSSFVERFRINSTQFELLYEKIGKYFYHETRRNNALTASQQMLNALHWLGTDAQFHAVGDMHGCSKATIHRNVHKFCNIIVTHMLKDNVKWPVNSENVAKSFFKYSGIPYVAGACDGTLIGILGPSENEPQYVDRKGNHSLNALMVCGADMVFYYVDANYPGSVHDARVLRNSSLYKKFEVDGWRPFPGAVILGDSAYPLKDWLIPYNLTNPEIESQRKLYNAHKLARHLVECAYGILKKKFPCLHFLRLEPKRAAKVILACTILHNICRNSSLVDEDFNYPAQILNSLEGTGLERLNAYFSQL